MNFYDKVNGAVGTNNSLLCVGIDPVVAKMPTQFQQDKENGLLNFGIYIADQTHDIVCAFKPQIAHFAASEDMSKGGMLNPELQLQRLISYIHERYPNIPVILDVKRGDIGATAENYEIEAFRRYKADAMTVNPYMGGDTITPYMLDGSKGVIVLCKTSNKGSGDLQNLVLADGTLLYQHVAKIATTTWNTSGQVALVVGATHPDELRDIRKLVGQDILFLVPGIGTQGGDVEKTVKAGQNLQGKGMIINSSSAINFPKSGMSPRDVAVETRDEINKYRTVNM